MKLKLAPHRKMQKHQKAEAASQKAANRITKINFDRHPAIVGNRIPAATVLKAARENTLTPMNKRGFLVVTGEKGVYTSEVRHNGKGLYVRIANKGCPCFASEKTLKDSRNFRYGDISALNDLGRENFKAEILSESEAIERVRKFGKVVSVNYAAEDERLTVGLMNSFGERFVGGLTTRNGRLYAITMEHPGKNARSVQYVDQKDVHGQNKTKFLASLVQ